MYTRQPSHYPVFSETEPVHAIYQGVVSTSARAMLHKGKANDPYNTINVRGVVLLEVSLHTATYVGHDTADTTEESVKELGV